MIKWCIGVWDEQYPEYIGMDKEGTLYWTGLLSEALLIEKPKGIIPPICVWLPVFIPNRIASSK